MFKDPISLLKFEHAVIRIRSDMALRTLGCGVDAVGGVAQFRGGLARKN